jgi:hypothetical protein
VTDNHGHNPAGYMLWALQRFADIAADRYAQHQFTPAELDLAASQEITYLWLHDRRWAQTPAALAACLRNLVLERPERLLLARRHLAAPRGRSGTTTPPWPSAQSTATHSSYTIPLKRVGTPRLIGCVLQGLTLQSSVARHNPEQRLPDNISNAYAQGTW